MSVHQSICSLAWNDSALTWRIFIKFHFWGFFEKVVENSIFIKISQQVFYMKNNILLWSSLSQFFIQWKIFHTEFVQKIDTHFKFNIPPSPKNAPYAVYEKGCRVQQATDDNMVHVHCMLDNYGYRHMRIICNIYSFSTATMVARTRLSVTLYVHCMLSFRLRSFRFNSIITLQQI